MRFLGIKPLQKLVYVHSAGSDSGISMLNFVRNMT